MTQVHVIRLAAVLCAVVATGVLVPTARACSIDGVASISVNGHMASLTTTKPTSATLAYWSSFSLLAATPCDALHYAENLANVSLSIPKASAALPFK